MIWIPASLLPAKIASALAGISFADPPLTIICGVVVNCWLFSAIVNELLVIPNRAFALAGVVESPPEIVKSGGWEY